MPFLVVSPGRLGGVIMVQGGIGPIGKAFIVFEILFVIVAVAAYLWYWAFGGRKR